MMLGVLPTKAGTYAELKALRFLINLPEIQKSSTMKGSKSSFRVSSYLNQRLIISNIQNQSMTDRQTNRQTKKL